MEEPRRLGGRYELGQVLGRGGMAEVYLAHDTRLGRTVAVKTLRADLARDPSFQARFRREAQSAASLNHPAIVAVYDTGEDYVDGVSIPYIVMEYVDGSTLRELLHSGRKLLPERAMEMTIGILQALEYSHRSGIVHRDIKPANVMLTPSGQVKVMDFGIARAIADTSSAMTQTAAVIGTAQYLSPEQARGETVDARSDIYSTGCLLYELLTGRPPFIGDSPVSVAYQHVREDARPPSQLNPDVSTTIDHIVAKSLAKRVEDRYQSAADMRKDIDRAIAGLQVDAPTAATVPVTGATAVAPAAPPLAPTSGGGARRALPPEGEEGGGNNAKWWGIGIVAVLLIGAIIFAIFKLTAPPPEIPQVKVPDVTGLEAEPAERVLTREGFKVDPEPELRADNKVKEGLILATDPPAGESTDKGDTIKLIVSSGPEEVTIPSLDGYSYDQAKELLEGKGLKVKKSEQDSALAKNKVINSDPPAGDTVDFGSTVTLLVSKGQSTVPQVVNLQQEAAIKAIEDAGLKAQVVEDPLSPAPQGTVTAQDRPQGTVVAPGTTITITVSTNPAVPPPADGDADADGP